MVSVRNTCNYSQALFAVVGSGMLVAPKVPKRSDRNMKTAEANVDVDSRIG